MKPARLHLHIDELRVSGLSSLDAHRLIDQLRLELTRLAPQLLQARRSRALRQIDAGSVALARRPEGSAAALAQAIVKAVQP